jgi:8-oxo-dGTP pyrophosphatase MutT (NUDIX family)
MKKAVCVLVKVGDFYLVSSRPNSSLWGLVGGKVDDGETTLQSIVREVQEEVGLDLNPLWLKEVYTGVCNGDVDYMTTTFTYPEISRDIYLSIKNEEGLHSNLLTKEELCNPKYSAFSVYLDHLFNIEGIQ